MFTVNGDGSGDTGNGGTGIEKVHIKKDIKKDELFIVN